MVSYSSGVPAGGVVCLRRRRGETMKQSWTTARAATLATVFTSQIAAASVYRLCATRIRRRNVLSLARAWLSPGGSVLRP